MQFLAANIIDYFPICYLCIIVLCMWVHPIHFDAVTAILTAREFNCPKFKVVFCIGISGCLGHAVHQAVVEQRDKKGRCHWIPQRHFEEGGAWPAGKVAQGGCKPSLHLCGRKFLFYFHYHNIFLFEFNNFQMNSSAWFVTALCLIKFKYIKHFTWLWWNLSQNLRAPPSSGWQINSG